MRAVHLKMILATVLLGSYLVASKLILREVPVFTATFVRLVSSSVVLGVYVRLKSPGLVRSGRRDSAVLMVQTLVGIFLFSVFAMYGVRFTGAIEAGAILGMVPVSISLVALVFLRESLSARRGVGIAFAVLGAVGINMLNAGSSGTPGTHAALGALLLVCAVLCEAVFLTFGKLLTVPIPPVKLSLILSVGGTLLFAAPAAIEFDWSRMSQVSWQTWALMIYTGVAINGIAVVLMYDSMDTVDTTTAAAFTALTPVSGTILSMVFIGEPLHAYHVVGMVLVVIGVFVVAKKPQSATPAKQRDPVVDTWAAAAQAMGHSGRPVARAATPRITPRPNEACAASATRGKPLTTPSRPAAADAAPGLPDGDAVATRQVPDILRERREVDRERWS